MIPDDVRNVLSQHGYDVIKHIGKGGFADCFLVFSHQYQQEFACKVITFKDFTPGCRRRRSSEAEYSSLAHLLHPNIIQIYNTITTNERIFMILEYCSKGDIQEYILSKTQKEWADDRQKDFISLFIYDAQSPHLP